MAQMLRVKRMPLGQFAHLMDESLINALVCIRKALVDERLPIFLGNGSERIMSTGPIKRAVAIQHHLLNQMFAAAQEEVPHLPVILDYAAQFPLHLVVAILQNLFLDEENRSE